MGLYEDALRLYENGRYLDARAMAQALVRREPASLQGWILLGQADRVRGSIVDALEAFQKAESLLCRVAGSERLLMEGYIAYHLGLCHGQRHRWGDAVQQYTRAVALFERAEVDHYRILACQNLAWALAEIGSPEEAGPWLDRVDHLTTEGRPWWVQRLTRVMVGLRGGDLVGVQDLVRELQALSPEEADDLVDVVSLAAALGSDAAERMGDHENARTLAAMAWEMASRQNDSLVLHIAGESVRRAQSAQLPPRQE